MNRLAAQTTLYLNVIWSTRLTADREAHHTVRIELHCCSGKRMRDSIQINLPPDATIKVLSAKCLERRSAAISPGYSPTTNKYCIELPRLFGQNPPDDLTLEISLKETGRVLKADKENVYLLGFAVYPSPASFEYTLHLPPYRYEIGRRLVEVFARAMKKPGAYNITILGARPEDINASRGSITYRFAGSYRFTGPALSIGVMYRKALRSAVCPLIFGFVAGVATSLFASWIYNLLRKEN